MSRLYSKHLDLDLDLDFDFYVRYLSSEDLFEFKCLDFYAYKKGEGKKYCLCKINEVDLLRMITIDKFPDLFYVEVEKQDLADDVFENISLAQFYCHVSKRTMILAKRQAHLRKLGKVSSAWLKLKKWNFHSQGGRPFGSKEVVDRYNLQNYDRIVANCVRKDWYKEFIQLHKDIAKMDRSLKLSDSAIKWKFMILRYLWKVENGYEELGTDKEYEKKLKEMNEKYKLDFIFDF